MDVDSMFKYLYTGLLMLGIVILIIGIIIGIVIIKMIT